MTAISEGISQKHALESIFQDYEEFWFCGHMRTGSDVEALLQKSFLDPDGRLVILGMNGSEGGTFRLSVRGCYGRDWKTIFLHVS